MIKHELKTREHSEFLGIETASSLELAFLLDSSMVITFRDNVTNELLGIIQYIENLESVSIVNNVGKDDIQEHLFHILKTSYPENTTFNKII